MSLSDELLTLPGAFVEEEPTVTPTPQPTSPTLAETGPVFSSATQTYNNQAEGLTALAQMIMSWLRPAQMNSWGGGTSQSDMFLNPQFGKGGPTMPNGPRYGLPIIDPKTLSDEAITGLTDTGQGGGGGGYGYWGGGGGGGGGYSFPSYNSQAPRWFMDAIYWRI